MFSCSIVRLLKCNIIYSGQVKDHEYKISFRISQLILTGI